jgi:4-alpha-glucanotransferase
VDTIASVTTHDLPTIAGIWTGADLEDHKAIGVPASEKDLTNMRRNLGRFTGLDHTAPVSEVRRRTHELLAEAPSRVVLVMLEDALEVLLRPNLPGTTAEQRDNWSVALPAPLEEWRAYDRIAETVAAMSKRIDSEKEPERVDDVTDHIAR